MEKRGEESQAPLLEPRPAAAENGGSDMVGEGGAEEEEVGLGRQLLEENRKLWAVAGPSICTRFSTFGVTVISQAFIGHIGPTELAAYALVSTVLMRFSNGILTSGIAPVQTFQSLHCIRSKFVSNQKRLMISNTTTNNSYGAKQYHMMGIYLQRSWIILSGCAVLMLPIFIFTEPLLVFIGQDPTISAVAGTISIWYIPVMFASVFNFTLQMYLQAQSKNLIITYLAFVNLGLHLFLSWLLTVKLHLGLAGVMTSMVIAMWIPAFGQLIFVLFGGCPLTWTGFSFTALTDLVPIFKLSLSSGVMLCLELWYSTILVLLTGYMKNAESALDALSICLNINGWEMMISIGFLAATGVRVANELGAGSAKRAKFAILNVVATSFSIGLVLFVFFLFFRGKLSYIFTTSEEVAALVADLSPLLAFSILLNSVQPVLSGVAVGAGWQSVVAYVNIATYYLIGIPLGAILGYVLGYHVKGIWVGMLLGTLVQTIVLLFITIRTDWDKQVEVTQERLKRWYMDGNNGKSDSSNMVFVYPLHSLGLVIRVEEHLRDVEHSGPGASVCTNFCAGTSEDLASIVVGNRVKRYEILLEVNYQIDTMHHQWKGVGLCSQVVLEDIATTLYFPVTSFLVQYLGLLLFIGKVPSSQLFPLAGKLRKKLATWKASMFSRVERLALVWHVLSAMPVQILLAMAISPPILKKVHQVIRYFLWHGRDVRVALS
ncbi:Protein TRANSPARENT TESTA 12 [Triticum urartu]|uniref:Protein DETOXIFICATION n=1 Tax=Triticum urartu TaxID=4572 RepID=M7YEX3_TRIUA|nr:Protein TRANSPARENT TESTA 12 [Triticum urartu]